MRGSVGDWTFSRNKNTIIVSQKIDKPKHPTRNAKTQPHRIRWANLTALWGPFYGKLKPSFQKKGERISDFNMFVKTNLSRKDVGVYLPKNIFLQGGCVIDAYTITEGTLPRIEVSGAAGAPKVTDVELGEGFTITDSTTVKAFSDAVVSHNGHKFKYGDQLSCYIIRQKNTSGGCPYVTVEAYEVTLDSSENSLKLRDIVNSNGFSVSNGYLAAGQAVVGGIVWVYSRTENSKYFVSTQNIVVENPYVETYRSAEALEEAIQSFGGLDNDQFLVPGYGNSVTSIDIDPSPAPTPDPSSETALLTIRFSPEECGTVYVDDHAYTEPVRVEKGKVTNLRFEAAEGFTFERWSDNERETERTVTLNSDTTITVSCSED